MTQICYKSFLTTRFFIQPDIFIDIFQREGTVDQCK